MATAIAAAALTLAFLLPRSDAVADPSAIARSLLSTTAPPSIVLPLLPPFSNSSRRSVVEARMGLHDDLLTNGYYTTRLYIGTPPHMFALIVDSGSTVTYVPCSTCKKCGKHQDPRFKPDSSSTYRPVKCSSKIVCDCDRTKNQCIYERKYAEMSSSSGVLGEDLVSFGDESELKPQRAVFGCENVETGDLYTQRADGIMGLGRGPLSIMDRLVERGVINDSFSLCYGGMDVGGGAMVLGDITTPHGMTFSYSNPNRSPYYNLDLKDIHVAGEPLHLNPRIFDRQHGTILDSGTTYAYLPEVAFVAVKEAIIKQIPSLKEVPGSDPKFKDFCFSGAGRDVSDLSKSFPELDMVFGNGQKLTLSPENYLFRRSKLSGVYCLGFFKNERDSSTLLGGIVVRNTLVTYDRKNNKIGFLKTDCSQLLEKLHLADAPLSPRLPPPSQAPQQPPSPNSYRQNESRDASAPPTGLKDQFLKGELTIEFITFDMYLNISYSELVPHVSELIGFLANELGVNASQIHLVSSMSVGNGSLVRWTLYPAGPNFFSTDTAMAIVSRLEEHHIHLPTNFGSYQLRAWNVEQRRFTRTWWQRHVLVLFLGGLAVAVLCSSAFLVWYLYNRKHHLNAYRPVDALVPEEELQTLR